MIETPMKMSILKDILTYCRYFIDNPDIFKERYQG